MKTKTGSDTLPAVIGIDIGKDVFHLVGFGADGTIAFRRKIRRLGLRDVFEKLPDGAARSGSRCGYPGCRQPRRDSA